MSGATAAAFELSELKPGHLQLRGAMTFATAAAVNAALSRLIIGSVGPEVHLDLHGVTRADSAGLAVVVEALAVARKLGRRVVLSGVPQAMDDIARISEIEDMLS